MRELPGRLPASIEPPVDLWPGIAERVGRGKVIEGRFAAGRPWWAAPRMLAAAAVALVVLSSAITAVLLRQRPGTPAVAGVTMVSTDFLALEAQYARASDEILGALRQGEVRIAPDTRAILERNLRVIDDAIAESRAALARDPANKDLKDMILSTYEHKLDLLRRVTYPKST